MTQITINVATAAMAISFLATMVALICAAMP